MAGLKLCKDEPCTCGTCGVIICEHVQEMLRATPPEVVAVVEAWKRLRPGIPFHVAPNAPITEGLKAWYSMDAEFACALDALAAKEGR